jgi:hypothetical protein
MKANHTVSFTALPDPQDVKGQYIEVKCRAPPRYVRTLPALTRGRSHLIMQQWAMLVAESGFPYVSNLVMFANPTK